MMKTPTDFGPSIAALSELSGVSPHHVVIQSAAVLTGVGGPHAGLLTLGQEFQSAGFHVISRAGESPQQHRLCELLLNPLRFIQEDLLNYSRWVPERKLKELSAEHYEGRPEYRYTARRPSEEENESLLRESVFFLAQETTEASAKISPWARLREIRYQQRQHESGGMDRETFSSLCSFVRSFPERMIGRDEERKLREPLILLDSPSVETVRQSMGAVDQSSPLIFDGGGALLEGASQPSASQAKKQLEAILVNRSAVGAGESGKTGYWPGQSQLFSVTSERVIGGLLGTQGFKSHLAHALVVDAPSSELETGMTVDPGEIESGYEAYRSALRGLLRLRRLDAMGLYPDLDRKGSIAFAEAQREFAQKIDEVDAAMRPHAARFFGLPVSILWTLRNLNSERSFDSLIPVAMEVSELAMREHLEKLLELQNAGESDAIELKAVEMLNKLVDAEPCSFRDLLRKYAIQRRAVHEPVLKHLVDTGKVQKIDGGQLRLSDAAREELLGTLPVEVSAA